MPHSRNGELRNTTDAHPDHQEDTTTADLGDDAAVDDDYEDASGGEDAGVHEGIANPSDLEKVRSVRYSLVSFR
jgi:hypothetical protein